jgi:molecular chaperone GrpE
MAEEMNENQVEEAAPVEVEIQPDAPVEDDSAPVEADLSDAGEGSDDTIADFPGLEILEDPATAEIQRLEGIIDELQGRLRAVSAAYQKQQGEVAAVRERLNRQAAVNDELRRGEVVAGLFEPVEDLRRSMESARKGATVEDTATGVELVLNKFMTGFQKLGLEEVPGKGAAFDPNVHEALTAMPVADPALDQVVIDVFTRGYRIGSRLIAPAKVIVGAYQEPVGEA